MPDYTILIVDYEPRSVESLRRPLVQAGYRVEVAKDGFDGAKRFEELKPDLTLIEAMLPKKHGFDLCRELKNSDHGKTSPILIITAVYRGRKYRYEAMHHYKCDAYLEKPISGERLVEVVGGLLGGVRPSERDKGDTPATVRDPAATAPVFQASEDEILERLDHVLPGSPPRPRGTDPDETKNALAEAGEADATVVSFDPDRSRTSTAHLTPMGGRVRQRGGGADAAALPAPLPQPPPSRRTDRRPTPGEVPDERPSPMRGRVFLWLAFLLLVVFGTAMFLLLL